VCLAAHVLECSGWTPVNVKLRLPPRQSRGVSYCVLDKEEQTLEGENLSIIEAASKLKFLLPAQERQAQRDADALLLAGKLEAALPELRPNWSAG
jgi:hypothetical protein